jgi:hypothetical protein
VFYRGRTGQAMDVVILHEDGSNKMSRNTGIDTILQGVISQNNEIFICICCNVFISHTAMTFLTFVGSSSSFVSLYHYPKHCNLHGMSNWMLIFSTIELLC